MLFTIKKFLEMILLPSGFLFFLLLVSFVLILRKKKLGMKLFGLAVFFYYVLSIPPVSNLLIKALENRYPYLEFPPQDIHYVVVLAEGTLNPYSGLPSNNRLSFGSMARVLEGLRLYKKMDDIHLILSGGSGRSLPQDEKPCILMKQLSLQLGVEENRILVECISRDTYEEAEEIRKMLGQERFILVTSAFHMPRSLLIFKKAGLNAIAAPCAFRVQGKTKHNWLKYFPSGLETSDIAVKEYIGILFYKYFK